VKLAETYAPGRGLYGVATLAGLTDVDAITLSMATSARDGATEPRVAANAIVIAALTNSLVSWGSCSGWGAAAEAPRRRRDRSAARGRRRRAPRALRA